MSDLVRLREQFASPSAIHRSAPFWAWNDELHIDELTRQIDGMNEQGIGGFFMHSRDGLETDYLGEQWMEAISASVRKAEQVGMHAWLYDEDRWPSGSAGGSIPAIGDEYRSKGLTIEVVRKPTSGVWPDAEHIVALFKAVIDDMTLHSCERLPLDAVPSCGEGEALLVFRVEVSAPSEWFNDEAPPDSMNPDTVRRFIEHTYEVYKKHVGEQFGRTIRGVFTDEPSVNDRHCKFAPGRGWVPWTYGMPAYFSANRGYDILEALPYLFFNGELSSRTRHDYWRTVAEKFSESFTKQLYDWCDANSLMFTGHYLQEDKLGTATRVSGAIMPHYRYQHIPGIDILCERTDEHMTVKQCTSVAHQYGRKQVISETYGCTGWEFTFEGQRWIGDWQYALGVNFRSQHLALYSLKGCRKRDYPPVFNYNTNWWPHNRLVEDYFARLGAVLTEGEPVRDVLVLHPASTAWSMLGSNPYGMPNRGRDRDIPGVNRYGDEFNSFLRALLGAHHDFDLGDETIMAETGSVDGASLIVNLAAYRAVVVPPIRTMLRSTYELLLKFAEAGGCIVVKGTPPTMIEGVAAAELDELFRHPSVRIVHDVQDVVSELDRTIGRSVSIRNGGDAEAGELFYMLRRAGDAYTLFVVNNDRNRSIDTLIELETAGRVERWNALTGNRSRTEAWTHNGKLRFRASFGPADSMLFVIDSTQMPAAAKPPAGPVVFNDRDLYAALGPVYRFTRTMPNALTLDMCRCRIGDGEWSEPLEVWQAQRRIRDALGMRQVYYNGMTQRYKWIHRPHPNDGTPVSLRFDFRVADPTAAKPIKLVLEEAHRFRIRLNGQDVANMADGFYLDRSLPAVPLAAAQPGLNELLLECDYEQAVELEDIYLIGDFALDASRSIVSEPNTLRTGDWCLQGYFHYCGSIVYHAEYVHVPENGPRALLRLGSFEAVTVEVRVNGRTAGHIPWKAADGVDLTSFLQEGRNTIDIEVAGSPRNVFGPFHQSRGRTATTSWESFRTEGVAYTPDYIVQPYGLMDQIKIERVI